MSHPLISKTNYDKHFNSLFHPFFTFTWCAARPLALFLHDNKWIKFSIFSHQVVSLTRRRMKFMVSAMGALPHGSDGIHYNQCKAKCHNNSNHYQIIQQMYLLRSKGKRKLSPVTKLTFFLCAWIENALKFRNFSRSKGIKRFHDHTLRMIFSKSFIQICHTQWDFVKLNIFSN